jgi:hypothetical protein
MAAVDAEAVVQRQFITSRLHQPRKASDATIKLPAVGDSLWPETSVQTHSDRRRASDFLIG